MYVYFLTSGGEDHTCQHSCLHESFYFYHFLLLRSTFAVSLVKLLVSQRYKQYKSVSVYLGISVMIPQHCFILNVVLHVNVQFESQENT